MFFDFTELLLHQKSRHQLKILAFRNRFHAITNISSEECCAFPPLMEKSFTYVENFTTMRRSHEKCYHYPHSLRNKHEKKPTTSLTIICKF